MTSNSDTELLTEHFGYPPVSLLDDIINAVNILAEKALKSIEQYLLSQPPHKIGFRNAGVASKSGKGSKGSSVATEQHGTALPPSTLEEAARFEIDNGTHQLETLLCSSIDKNFDLFELYVMRNILCVRPEDRNWMRLKHYELLDFSSAPPGEEEEEEGRGAGIDSAGGPSAAAVASTEGVNALRRKVQASQRLNALLAAEMAQNDALLERLRALTGRSAATTVKAEKEEQGTEQQVGGETAAAAAAAAPLAFLRDKGSLAEGSRADAPIQTTTAFALSQLQALRSLSTSLRNLSPDMAALAAARGKEEGGGGGEPESRKGWRRERTEYVEGAVRKHLERERGLELGRQGEVRDGEWQGAGRKYARDEVEGLERVAGAMGVGGKKAAGDEMDES